MLNGLKPIFTLCTEFCFKNSLFHSYVTIRKLHLNLSKDHSLQPPWRVLFFGTDEFALESLKALCAKLRTGTLMSSLGIVTKKGCVVSEFGLKEKLPLYSWPVKVSEIINLFDVGMVVSFGNLIPEDIITSLPMGCINVHASLLPRWRGAAPIFHAIMSGDNETGVTIMRIHPHKFDIGEIVRQYRVPIEWDETTVSLEKKLAVHGSRLLMECLRDLKNSLDMAVPQSKTGITYAPKVTAETARIDWTKADAKSVFDLHRALSHLFPLKTTWHGIPVRLKKIHYDPSGPRTLLSNSTYDGDSLKKSAANFLNLSSSELSIKNNPKPCNEDAGKCLYNKRNKLLRVVCADDQCVVVEALQIGGKHMSAVDFFNGYLSKWEVSDWKFI